MRTGKAVTISRFGPIDHGKCKRLLQGSSAPALHSQKPRLRALIVSCAMKTLTLLLLAALRLTAADFPARFEEIRKTASPAELYSFLFALPKGRRPSSSQRSLRLRLGLVQRWQPRRRPSRRNSFYTMTPAGQLPGYHRHFTSLSHHPEIPLRHSARLPESPVSAACIAFGGNESGLDFIADSR